MLTNPGETLFQPQEWELTELADLPTRHQEALVRTREIAQMVGHELAVHAVDSIEDVPLEPGAYLFKGDIPSENYQNILGAQFSLNPAVLSGKVDSAHAVLPGTLSLMQAVHGKYAEKHVSVATKGYFKREMSDRFARLVKEVEISHLQRQLGELAYEPLAIVVAPCEETISGEHDLLLVSRLDTGATTLDNNPWQVGFEEANLELAETALAALGRYNATIGQHGDAKPKNVAQYPHGLTSMIDFETATPIDWGDALSVATAVHEDFLTMLSCLVDAGFFNRELWRAETVLNKLGEIYLEQWNQHPEHIQESVYKQIADEIDHIGEQIGIRV